MLDVKA